MMWLKQMGHDDLANFHSSPRERELWFGTRDFGFSNIGLYKGTCLFKIIQVGYLIFLIEKVHWHYSHLHFKDGCTNARDTYDPISHICG